MKKTALAALAATVALSGAATGCAVEDQAAAAKAAAVVKEPADAPALPRGFALNDIATGQGTNNLTDFGFLPGGSVLAIGHDGRVTWVPKDGLPTTIANLGTDTSGSLGLVGLGIAPDYRTTHHIYLIRSIPSLSAPPYRIRLSRFTVRGGDTPTGLAHEKVLFVVKAPAPTHGMTTVLPARDGTLWVSIGDLRPYTTVVPGALQAMRIGRPEGKLLHVRANGAGVRSNPYYRASHPFSWRSRTYASGFRSPFRFSLDPATGRPIVGDVGWNTWEEVDLVRAGGNYRWPCWEGPAETPGYRLLPRCAHVPNTPPVWSYHHGSAATQGDSVTGGIVYRGKHYPQRYRGAYFFGDYVGHKIWTMRFSSTGRLVRRPENPPFGTGVGAPVRFAAAPNGDVVYADISSGNLRRLTY